MTPEHTHYTSRTRENTLLFIIGPAGVGKSTCGRLLAHELGFIFIDLDAEFNRQIGDIQTCIDQNGYLAYCRRNTELFYDLVDDTVERAVYAVSSGFLLYDELDACFTSNADALTRLGISILLLPSESLSNSTNIVVTRLINRRPWLDPQNEARKFVHRYQKYQRYGDIKIFSKLGPSAVSRHIKDQYLAYLRTCTTHHDVDPTPTIASRDEDATDID